MTGLTDASGTQRGFAYDAKGQQTGSSFTWVNPENPSDTKQIATSTIYDQSGAAISSTDPEGKTSTTQYNSFGKPVQTTDAQGNVTISVYDLRGNVIESRSADNQISRTVYDANGRAVVSQDRHTEGQPAGGSRTTYNALGQVVKTERLASVQIDLVQEGGQPAARLISSGEVLGSSSSVYDAAGRLSESTDEIGRKTRYEYDAAGRQTASIDSKGRRFESVYDALGRRVLSRDNLKRETRYEYDLLGRLVKTTAPDGSISRSEYDAQGRRISATDATGKIRRYEYDQLGRLSAVILPEVLDPETQTKLSPRYAYAYNRYGNLISITDPKGRETSFSYDHLGRQLSRSLPGGRTESQTYDSFGHLKTRKDFQGRITEMVYDTLGRTTQRLIFANQAAFDSRTIARQVKWNYDALGRLASLEEPRGVSSYSYDLDGRLTSLASPEGTINYGYDAFGRKIRTWTTNSDIRYDYDSEGRLAQVAVYKQRGQILSQPETTKYLYDDSTGQRSGIDQSNGVATRYSYDLMGRLSGLSHSKASQLLASYTYSLRADGRRSGLSEKRLEASGVLSQTSISYTYDELNRLTQEASTSDDPGAVFQTSYSYDLCGNRLKKATAGSESIDYAYNAADQLLSENSSSKGQTAYAYDAGGNLISKNGSGESAAYAYDLEGRMVTAEIARIEQGRAVTATSNYAYNLAGTRVGAVTNGNVQGQGAFSESRKFLVDEANFTGYSQVLEEFDGTGALSRSYVIGDDILSQNRGNGSETLLADGHGSTRLLTHSSGAVMERYSFDAYGVLLGGNKGISNRAGTNYLYSGEEYDDSLQMQYLRARYYDQNTGGFNCQVSRKSDQFCLI